MAPCLMCAMTPTLLRPRHGVSHHTVPSASPSWESDPDLEAWASCLSGLGPQGGALTHSPPGPQSRGGVSWRDVGPLPGDPPWLCSPTDPAALISEGTDARSPPSLAAPGPYRSPRVSAVSTQQDHEETEVHTLSHPRVRSL